VLWASFGGRADLTPGASCALAVALPDANSRRDNSHGAPVQARQLAVGTGRPRRMTAFGGSK
jgi:hypothetical protein